MIEYVVYEKDEEFKAVKASGYFCWQAFFIGMFKIPFSSAIYPAYKKEWRIALVAFLLELLAFVLIFTIGPSVKIISIVLVLIAVFGISIFYYKIQRWLAAKYSGDVVGRFYSNSPEQAISEAIKKS